MNNRIYKLTIVLAAFFFLVSACSASDKMDSLACSTQALKSAISTGTPESLNEALQLAGKLQRDIRRQLQELHHDKAPADVAIVPVEPGGRISGRVEASSRPSPQRQFELTEKTHRPTTFSDTRPGAGFIAVRLNEMQFELERLHAALKSGKLTADQSRSADVLVKLAGPCKAEILK